MTGKPRIPRSIAAQPEHDRLVAALSPITDKDALRKQLLQQRRALDPQEKAGWDARIVALLLQWCQQHNTRALGVYWPLPGEADLQPAYAQLAADGVQLNLPVVLERHAALGFAAWTPGETMHKDTMGVAVPQRLRLVATPPVLLVPCLGFNADKFRLGYGGGYYDRTLAATPRPLTLGVAYAALHTLFASAAHDVALDWIVTERGVQ